MYYCLSSLQTAIGCSRFSDLTSPAIVARIGLDCVDMVKSSSEIVWNWSSANARSP
ncbi:MAG: hypothetical protein V7K27_09465 [Nostoc sp.]|uniref:hypothetical protein n=1 Tax=Nostoc sp. TaxID=1180 RepID=UPI002FFC0D7F